MEYQMITNLLGSTSDKVPRFITKKWIEVHDQSGTAENRYNPNKQIRFKTSMLRSDLCGYNDAYIVVKGDITVEEAQCTIYLCTIYFLHFKNKWCINRQCRKFRCCNASVWSA